MDPVNNAATTLALGQHQLLDPFGRACVSPVPDKPQQALSSARNKVWAWQHKVRSQVHTDWSELCACTGLEIADAHDYDAHLADVRCCGQNRLLVQLQLKTEGHGIADATSSDGQLDLRLPRKRSVNSEPARDIMTCQAPILFLSASMRTAC